MMAGWKRVYLGVGYVIGVAALSGWFVARMATSLQEIDEIQAEFDREFANSSQSIDEILESLDKMDADLNSMDQSLTDILTDIQTNSCETAELLGVDGPEACGQATP